MTGVGPGYSCNDIIPFCFANLLSTVLCTCSLPLYRNLTESMLSILQRIASDLGRRQER